MARHFVDTSALVKIYRTEPNSAEVRSCFSPEDTLVLSGIGFLEYQSAFFGLVRQNLISSGDAQQRIDLLKTDLGNFVVVDVAQAIVGEAEQLLSRFGIREGLRPLDAIQLACGLQANAEEPLDSFLTTDTVLGTCAKVLGLTVKP